VSRFSIIQLSGGERSAPSHVNLAGMCRSLTVGNAELSNVQPGPAPFRPGSSNRRKRFEVHGLTARLVGSALGSALLVVALAGGHAPADSGPPNVTFADEIDGANLVVLVRFDARFDRRRRAMTGPRR